jgi:hypothetical protein
MKQGKRFFFEKKNQKTFARLGLGAVHTHGKSYQSFFCRLAARFFFVHKKEVLPCLYLG